MKVYKAVNDSVQSFLGAPVNMDETGKEFFELDPALKELSAGYPNLEWTEEQPVKAK